MLYGFLVMIGLFFGKAIGHGLFAGLSHRENSFGSILVAIIIIVLLLSMVMQRSCYVTKNVKNKSVIILGFISFNFLRRLCSGRNDGVLKWKQS